MLSPSELKIALEALSAMAKQEADAEGTDEPPFVALTDQQVKQIVGCLDTNGDGLVDYDEFLEAFDLRDSMEI